MQAPASVLTLMLLGVIMAEATRPLAGAEEARIVVHAKEPLGAVSRYMTGACIEDVNHEIYGGIYSQMIFGESFQEPPPPLPVKGFTAYGGHWLPKDGELLADAGDGPKLICDEPAFTVGEAGVEILLPEKKAGNAGFVVKAGKAGVGPDRFDGYEVALDTGGQLVLHRHRQNWEPINSTPCQVPVNEWIALVVKMTEKTVEILVNGKSIVTFEDMTHPLASGQVGFRTWQRAARYRNLWIKTGDQKKEIPFQLGKDGGWGDGVSGMWRACRRGSAKGEFRIGQQGAFLGTQSQRIAFTEGDGAVGIENMGLNRWGMCFRAEKAYEGYIWVKAEKPAELVVALQSDDGAKTYAEKPLSAAAGDWQRLDFTLTPNAGDTHGRFAVLLAKPGSVLIGHAFLQPGEWGRFKGLPCRKDVVDGLLAQGVTVLRYGGSMVNHGEYLWKKMIGPRDRRPPYRGTWYPYSSNGWGIVDFLDLCEAMGIPSIPDFNMGETPQDMADFIGYVNGPADSEWGRKRAADGHPAPYQLKFLELGNEEAINENYWQKFKPLAEAIWAKDASIIIVVGDFVYGKPIEDPFSFEGAASRITTMAAHQKILQLAREREREVWFDIHIGTEQPHGLGELRVVPTYVRALDKVSGGARHKVAIFELNAGNHAHRRGLANACAISELERSGESVPLVCSANCLQPDKQNDNSWDQGLLFLNPSQVWLQSPGYVTQMISRNYLPKCVRSEVQAPGGALTVTAKTSEDGKVLQLQVANIEKAPVAATIALDGFTPAKPTAHVTELAGQMSDVNTAEEPEHIKPKESDWPHQANDGIVNYTFPPFSFTVVRFE